MLRYRLGLGFRWMLRLGAQAGERGDDDTRLNEGFGSVMLFSSYQIRFDGSVLVFVYNSFYRSPLDSLVCKFVSVSLQ